MTTPAIYLDGVPQNLEAAATDALEWLHWAKSPRRTAKNDERLDELIAALIRFLPDVEPVLEENK